MHEIIHFQQIEFWDLKRLDKIKLQWRHLLIDRKLKYFLGKTISCKIFVKTTFLLELNSNVGHLIILLISLRPCIFRWDQFFGNCATFLLSDFSKYSVCFVVISRRNNWETSRNLGYSQISKSDFLKFEGNKWSVINVYIGNTVS